MSENGLNLDYMGALKNKSALRNGAGGAPAHPHVHSFCRRRALGFPVVLSSFVGVGCSVASCLGAGSSVASCLGTGSSVARCLGSGCSVAKARPAGTRGGSLSFGSEKNEKTEMKN